VREKKWYVSRLILLGMSISVAGLGWGYKWPVKPFNSQHYVSSVLDECRGSRDHFHDGIDIGGSGTDVQTDTVVFAVKSGKVQWTLDQEGLWVKGDIDTFFYYHLKDMVLNNSEVGQGDSLGRVNYANHLHFSDGYQHREINPLRTGGISPFVDSDAPNFYFDPIKIYVNDSDGDYDDWQELEYDNVHGEVDIVVGVSDKITNGGNNAGLYSLGYEISRLNEWGLWERLIYHYNFKFDNWLDNAYMMVWQKV